MKCPNCGKADNAAGDDFCVGCGSELTASSAPAAATAAPAQTSVAPAPTPAPAPTGVSAFTVVFGDKTFPLYDGQTFTMRRDGSGDADLGLPGDDIPRTPFELTVKGGKLFAKYGGTEPKAWAALVNLKPGEEIELEAGDAIMAGEGTPIMIS